MYLGIGRFASIERMRVLGMNVTTSKSNMPTMNGVCPYRAGQPRPALIGTRAKALARQAWLQIMGEQEETGSQVGGELPRPYRIYSRLKAQQGSPFPKDGELAN